MIKIKNFTLSGVGRFVEKQTIDFTKLGNLVQVDAENRNTGGSSGSGKTTIFHAIEYNLGINDLPTSVLQSRLTENGLFTYGEYEVDGKELKITRSKSKFSIEFDGEVTSGSSKITEEKLDNVIGMDRKLFRPMLHKRQKEGGFFLDFTPAKMNDFLTSALGLSEYRVKLEVVDAKIKELLDTTNKASFKLEASRSGLKSTNDAILALGEAPESTVTEDKVRELEAAWKASEAAVTTIQDRYKKAKDELKLTKPEFVTTPFDRTQIDAFERGINIVKQKIDLIRSDERDRLTSITKQIGEAKLELQKAQVLAKNGEKSAREVSVIVEEIKKIRASLCPTCEQNWATEAAKAREDALIVKLKQYRQNVADGTQAQAEATVLEDKIAQLQLQNTPKAFIPELAQLEQKMNELAHKIQEELGKERKHAGAEATANRTLLSEYLQKESLVDQEFSGILSEAKSAVANAKSQHTAILVKRKEESDQVARYERSAGMLMEHLAAHNATIIELENKLQDMSTELEVAEEVKKAVKSYVSCSFDDALESIGDAATRIIRAIPNMANATIQFEGLKENKDGKIKEEVNAVISMDGEVGVPIKSLSGGERSSVDLAVDLAVIDLLENKSNRGIDVFILDEPFTGLDTVSIEMALEVLRNSNLNKKLIIVDHNAEVKEMVESRLVVVREGATSRVEQI